MRAFFFKVFKFFYGFLLFSVYSKRLDVKKLIKGKRVAIVGAASSALNTERGEYIDQFDVVIRLNKAPTVIAEGKWTKDIGKKTDVLFHSFFENEIFGGGVLAFDLYKRLNISFVVNPLSSFFGYRNTFNFYKKYLSRETVYQIPAKDFKTIIKPFADFRPTIGYCALHILLNSDFKELYITGFTFFRTNYADGYRNSLQEVKTVRKTMEDMKIHNPDLEFYEFLKLYKTKNNHKIILDKTLNAIVQSELENDRVQAI